MITLYGVTEDGTSVPVQVTEDGKIVAIGQKGDPGPPGADGESIAGPPGPEGPPGEVQNGDDVEFGSITAADQVQANGGLQAYIPTNNLQSYSQRWFDNKYGTRSPVGGMNVGGSMWAKQSFTVGTDINDPQVTISSDGKVTAAGGKGGFNTTGELIFFSRNQRYRAVVQNNNVMAEEYTREMELKEMAENKLEELSEPNTGTPDIVPED